MFVLPRNINSGDKIGITGSLSSDKRRLIISLLQGDSLPDYTNIACQFEAKFPNESSNEDEVSVKIIENGYESIIDGDQQNTATDIFTESTFYFEILLRVRGYNGPMVDIYINQSPIIVDVQLKHSLSDIKFLSVSGDVIKVEKLDFEFGDNSY